MTCKPEAVIFDLYETLITHFDPDRSSGPSIAEQLGLDDRAFARAWKGIYDRRNAGTIPDYRSALREAARSLGCTPGEELIRRLDEAHTAGHERLFLRIEHDILEMLKAIRGQSVKLGLISNTTPEEVTAWEDCALAPHFDDVVFSYRVGLVKPDRQIYQLACERLGVPPSSTIFVGDGGDDELAGASEAGLEAYWASWFLDRWPNWEARFGRPSVWRFQRLRFTSEVVRLLVGHASIGRQ
jgi:putative hydrolase of the HAD superfamily